MTKSTKPAPKPAPGQRIIASLKDAIAGNFSAVTTNAQNWRRIGFVKSTKFGVPAGWGAAACCPMVRR